MNAQRGAEIHPAVEEQIQAVIGGIDGSEIDGELLGLAAIGGEELPPTADHPINISPTRIALSEADRLARETFVKPRMQAAGMDVLDDHPLGITGIFPGRRRDLAPVLVLSHIDTVSQADRYDGVLGVEAFLKTFEIMHRLGIRTERDIRGLAVTGEESVGFDQALFGSRGLLLGLDDDQLDSRAVGGPSIREALGEQGARRAMTPAFGPDRVTQQPVPYAAIELHVEQSRLLSDGEYDLGVVDNIAAPVRYQAASGEWPLPRDTSVYEHERYLHLTVHGVTNHSGATPMGDGRRADGLVETARLLGDFLDTQDGQQVLGVGSVEVVKAAMNKVPGETTTSLRLASDSRRVLEARYEQLQAHLERRAAQLAEMKTPFPAEPFSLSEISKEQAGAFFSPQLIARRQRAAFYLISSVNRAAGEHAAQNVVGTVASFDTRPEGIISMKVDIRGIDQAARDRTVWQIENDIREYDRRRLFQLDLGEPLPGSGDAPVPLDERLVQVSLDTIGRLGIAKATRMFSAAGHDTQNVARAGIPSVMIFCESKDGKAHDPEAYTSPESLGMGARALAAVMLRLANETAA